MTDGLDLALTAVALDLLAADTLLKVYDGVVPAGATRPYVLAYTSLSRSSEDPDNAADGLTRVWTVRWILHCVGESAAAARKVAERVRTALLDVQPSVPGLSCGLIRMEGDSSPPERDEFTGVPVLDAVVTYRLRANG
jgi:hypothetical protein